MPNGYDDQPNLINQQYDAQGRNVEQAVLGGVLGVTPDLSIVNPLIAQLPGPNSGLNQQLQQQAIAAQAQRANPFNNGAANQSRDAQVALLKQMQAQANGPSVAGLLGQQALGGNLSAALGGLAAGGGGTGQANAFNAASAGGQQVANKVGTSRMQEYLSALQGQGQLANGLRGREIQAANANSQAGLQQRALDDANAKFYAALGSNYANTLDQNQLRINNIRSQVQNNNTTSTTNAIKNGTQTVGSIAGLLALL